MGPMIGRGFGWRYWQKQPNSEPLAKEEERKILEAELKEIESEKNEIEKRLKGIKQASADLNKI